MARNTIGMRRGSVRGAPPQVYIPFGSYDPAEHQIRAAVKFFSDWFKIAVLFVLVMFALVVFVTFYEGE